MRSEYMKRNMIVTLCAAAGIVVIGVCGLVISMNIDKQGQSSKVEQVPMNVTSSKDENEEDTKVETIDKNTNGNIEATTFLFDATAIIIEHDRNIKDEGFEISFESAVMIGLEYIRDTYGGTFDTIDVKMDTTSTSGILSGSVAWYEVVEMDNNKRYEITINTQTGEVMNVQEYYKENASDNKWVKADTSSKNNEYKVEKLDLEAFSNIEVNIEYNADVEIVTGDSYGVILHYYGPDYSIDYSNESGVLRIADDVTDKAYEMSNQRVNNYVTIIVPGDTNLSTVDIIATSGDISLKSVQTNDIKTLTYSGDSSFVDMIIGSGDLQTYSGDIDVKDLQSSTVKMTSISGDITVKGKVYGSSTFEATSGDVVIACKEQEKMYSYNLSTTSGSIGVNGKVVEDEVGAEKNVQNSKENIIKATSTSGDIDIAFDN